MKFTTMYNEHLQTKIYIRYFVCVCGVLVCTCMIGRAYLCMSMCRPDVSYVLLLIFTLLFETVSSLNVRLTVCARLTGYQAFGIHLSPSHQCQDCRHCPYNSF